jgi:hypothetical protein
MMQVQGISPSTQHMVCQAPFQCASLLPAGTGSSSQGRAAGQVVVRGQHSINSSSSSTTPLGLHQGHCGASSSCSSGPAGMAPTPSSSSSSSSSARLGLTQGLSSSTVGLGVGQVLRPSAGGGPGVGQHLLRLLVGLAASARGGVCRVMLAQARRVGTPTRPAARQQQAGVVEVGHPALAAQAPGRVAQYSPCLPLSSWLAELRQASPWGGMRTLLRPSGQQDNRCAVLFTCQCTFYGHTATQHACASVVTAVDQHLVLCRSVEGTREDATSNTWFIPMEHLEVRT